MVYYPQIKPERGITMKKLALVFAAALALTACTAAPTETATVPATADPPAEAAATEENADAEQFPVGELRLCDDRRRDTDTAYYTLYGHVDTTELTGLKAGLCRRCADQGNVARYCRYPPLRFSCHKR